MASYWAFHQSPLFAHFRLDYVLCIASTNRNQDIPFLPTLATSLSDRFSGLYSVVERVTKAPVVIDTDHHTIHNASRIIHHIRFFIL